MVTGRAADRSAGSLGIRMGQLFHHRFTLVLQVILPAGAGAAVWEQQWLNALITAGIIAIILLPRFLKKKLLVFIPPEFELLAIAFVFASLFLGEVRGYSVRFRWRDIALHAASGFLLGHFSTK